MIKIYISKEILRSINNKIRYKNIQKLEIIFSQPSLVCTMHIIYYAT